MPLAWPPALPAVAKYGGSEMGVDRLLHQETASGPGKLRSKYSTGIKVFTFPMILTETQADTLMDFYNDTSGGGALSFDFTHPRTGAAIVCRFKPGSMPLIVNFSFELYRVTLELEIIP
jgi:hypothetical protein